MTARRLHPACLLLPFAALVAGCSGGHPAPGGAPTAPEVTQTAVSVPPRPRPTEPLAPDTACVSAGCHEDVNAVPFVHGVLRSGGNCMVCHEEDQGGHVYPMRLEGTETCTFCHDAVVDHRVHQHAATEVACITCHDPHGSEHRSLLRAATATLCGACHPPSATAVSHAPYASGACTACHEPHESDFAHMLRGGEGAEHCYLCHEAIHERLSSSAFVHEPAADDCGTCHEPHGSAHPHVLRQPIEENCFTCHPEIEQTLAAVTAPHGAVSLGDKCANCHDAHAANREHLLKDREDALCMQCHDTEIEAFDGRTIPDMTASIRDREFLHGPVEAGDCSACHHVHGGSQTRLLTEQFTEAFYTSFDIKHYALCFQCHEPALVTEARTDALTDFRDGDLNLHFLHVNRDDKGRTCRACHEMHGSNLPAHVAESVPFGASQWALPIGFEKTDTGGSCAPGCHKAMSYDRFVPTWGAEQP